MKVAVSARIIDRNVGGNTRYARHVHGGAGDYESLLLRPRGSRSTASYALHEGFIWPRTTHADVLHLPADTGGFLRGRAPVVTTVHGLGYRHVRGIRSRRSELIWKSRVAASVRASDAIITVSQSSAEDIIDEFGLPAERVHVIPHGVDPMFSPGIVRDEERARLTTLGFPDRFMLYLGNLEPRKNLRALISAAEMTYGETGVKLVICGATAWDFQEILHDIEASSSVVYAGRLPEDLLVPAYRAAELFCFPSKYEGFGLPVLEAMAAGTPVATTRAGSLREVADGATFAIDGLDDTAIARTLREAMSDPRAREEMVTAGLKRASEFTWSQSLRLHHEVFRGLT